MRFLLCEAYSVIRHALDPFVAAIAGQQAADRKLFPKIEFFV
jgi:hypothetical protein